MKVYTIFITCCLAVIFFFSFISCKKETDKIARCKIVTITSNTPQGIEVHSFTYNNDGKISTFNTSGADVQNRVYSYSGNGITVAATDGSGNLLSTDTITLDGSGRLLNFRRYFQPSATWTNLRFEFVDDELARIVSTRQNASTPTIYQATYLNGNMMFIQSASRTDMYEYDMDKKVQPGDYHQFAALISFGISIYPQKNLVREYRDSFGNVVRFSYEFNDDGLIRKLLTITGFTVSTVTYQYQCD